MIRRNHLLLGLGIVAFSASGIWTQAQGQACAIDAYAASACGSGVGDHTSQTGQTDKGINHNGGCATCVRWLVGEVSYANCHSCSGLEDGEEGQFALLVEAAAVGDVKAFLATASRVPSRVSVNYSRSSVQLMACDGVRVLANVPLKPARLAMLERDLSRSRALAVQKQRDNWSKASFVLQ